MLRAVAGAAFDVVLREETRETEVFLLQRPDRGRVALTTAAPDGETTFQWTRGLDGRPSAYRATPVTAERIAEFCGNWLQMPVFDQTGLDGRYDVSLQWHDEDGPADREGDGLRKSPVGTARSHIEACPAGPEVLGDREPLTPRDDGPRLTAPRAGRRRRPGRAGGRGSGRATAAGVTATGRAASNRRPSAVSNRTCNCNSRFAPPAAVPVTANGNPEPVAGPEGGAPPTVAAPAASNAHDPTVRSGPSAARSVRSISTDPAAFTGGAVGVDRGEGHGEQFVAGGAVAVQRAGEEFGDAHPRHAAQRAGLFGGPRRRPPRRRRGGRGGPAFRPPPRSSPPSGSSRGRSPSARASWVRIRSPRTAAAFSVARHPAPPATAAQPTASSASGAAAGTRGRTGRL